MEKKLNNEITENKLEEVALGLVPLKNKVQHKKEEQIDKNTAAFKLKEVIKNKVPRGREFTTSYISSDFKALGYRSTDLSGQMYHLKNSGYLENRRLEDEKEIEIYGSGIRIWHATEKFYDYMDKVEEKDRTLNEIVAEQNTEYKEVN